jgi:hypothetical protein
VIDPGGSVDGFDDVQDLHEKCVPLVRLVINALKTIPQKVCRVECKGAGKPCQAGNLLAQAGRH